MKSICSDNMVKIVEILDNSSIADEEKNEILNLFSEIVEEGNGVLKEAIDSNSTMKLENDYLKFDKEATAREMKFKVKKMREYIIRLERRGNNQGPFGKFN